MAEQRKKREILNSPNTIFKKAKELTQKHCKKEIVTPLRDLSKERKAVHSKSQSETPKCCVFQKRTPEENGLDSCLAKLKEVEMKWNTIKTELHPRSLTATPSASTRHLPVHLFSDTIVNKANLRSESTFDTRSKFPENCSRVSFPTHIRELTPKLERDEFSREREKIHLNKELGESKPKTAEKLKRKQACRSQTRKNSQVGIPISKYPTSLCCHPLFREKTFCKTSDDSIKNLIQIAKDLKRQFDNNGKKKNDFFLNTIAIPEGVLSEENSRIYLNSKEKKIIQENKKSIIKGIAINQKDGYSKSQAIRKKFNSNNNSKEIELRHRQTPKRPPLHSENILAVTKKANAITYKFHIKQEKELRKMQSPNVVTKKEVGYKKRRDEARSKSKTPYNKHRLLDYPSKDAALALKSQTEKHNMLKIAQSKAEMVQGLKYSKK